MTHTTPNFGDFPLEIYPRGLSGVRENLPPLTRTGAITSCRCMTCGRRHSASPGGGRAPETCDRADAAPEARI